MIFVAISRTQRAISSQLWRTPVLLVNIALGKTNKNSSGDETANVNFYDDIARTSKH